MIIVVSNKKESAAKTSHSHLSVRQSNNYGKLNYLCIVEMLKHFTQRVKGRGMCWHHISFVMVQTHCFHGTRDFNLQATCLNRHYSIMIKFPSTDILYIHKNNNIIIINYSILRKQGMNQKRCPVRWANLAKKKKSHQSSPHIERPLTASVN